MCESEIIEPQLAGSSRFGCLPDHTTKRFINLDFQFLARTAAFCGTQPGKPAHATW
jgi:hypothetical protein